MSAIADLSRNTRQALCLVAAVLIVAGSLMAWQRAADAGEHQGYSVTIQQLQ